jgi:hypothetical protein
MPICRADRGGKGYSARTGGQQQMTAAVHTPVSLHPVQTSQAWTTPRRLRISSIALAIVAVTAGVVGGVTMLARQDAANRAVGTAEPLVFDAQTLDVAMSEANTTIAGGFLAGPVGPASVQSGFDQDMAQAASALAAVSQRAGSGSDVSRLLATLTSGLPIYAEEIATAEQYWRQGFPVGAAYLGEANNLMRTHLVPAATTLYAIEQTRLSHDDNRASSSILVAVVLILLLIVALAALLLHIDVARRFRRLINVGLAIAIVAVLALGVWAVVAAVSSGRAVSAAEHRGTSPLGTLTDARIKAQQASADDELSLVTGYSESSYQKDYSAAAHSVATLVGARTTGWTAAEIGDLSEAASAWSAYGEEHNAIQSSDQTGGLLKAISTDKSGAAPAAAAVDAPLSAGVATAVSSFSRNDRSASNDLSWLALGCVVLMLIAAAAILIGVEPRIREYR